MMEKLKQAFEYFRTESGSPNIYIRVGDLFWYSLLLEDGNERYGSIDAEEILTVMQELPKDRQLEIITQRNDAGEYDIPDIDRIIYEKSLCEE